MNFDTLLKYVLLIILGSLFLKDGFNLILDFLIGLYDALADLLIPGSSTSPTVYKVLTILAFCLFGFLLFENRKNLL